MYFLKQNRYGIERKLHTVHVGAFEDSIDARTGATKLKKKF